MVSDWFLLVFIGDIVVMTIYVFSFLGYKIPCMYIRLYSIFAVSAVRNFQCNIF